MYVQVRAMPLYKVKCSTSDGEILEKSLNGRSADSVSRVFREDGYYVFSVKRASFFPGTHKKIPLQNFLLFNRELSGLIKAGLPIVEGLGVLLKKMPDSSLKRMITHVRDRLIKGASLSEAFRDFQHLIPAYYPTLLFAGEQSGQLEAVLDKFIIQEERRRKALKRLRQAMAYPMILLAVAGVALYVILGQAMPAFAALYAGSGQELPWLTRGVLAFSNHLAAIAPVLLVLFIISGVLFPFMARKSFVQIMLEKLISRTPVLGKIWRLHNQNSFISSLQLLLQGGIPMAQALKTISTAVPSRILGNQLEKVWNDVVCGTDLSEALTVHTALEPRVMEMMRIGETSGTLDEMLDHLVHYGEENLDDQLEWISGIVAPVLLLLVGVFIAILVLAMYLPMFKVTDLMAR
jgi:type II secretory pathway component PulF